MIPVHDSTILGEAWDIIHGDREKTYGSPDKNLSLVANYWNIYIKALTGTDPGLTGESVCLMMILLKLARLQNSPTHRDSQVDICGYAALMNKVQGSFQNPANPS